MERKERKKESQPWVEHVVISVTLLSIRVVRPLTLNFMERIAVSLDHLNSKLSKPQIFIIRKKIVVT